MKNFKKRHTLLKKVAVGVLILILLSIVFMFGLLWKNLNKIHREDKCEQIKDEGVFSDEEILNILLIGEDRRPGEERTRSDSMIIMTIDKENKVIKLTSLMRDLYVQIPEYSYNRMDTAYTVGGIPLLEATIEQNFNIDIDGSIEVDFSGFRGVIDNIGGIELNIAKDEIDVLNSYIQECNKIFGEKENSNLINQPGLQKLNGLQVLAHSRSRYIENGDFGRTERQREILVAVSKQIKNLGLCDIWETTDTVLPLLTTDMNNIELLKLCISIGKTGISNIETHNIPVEGSFEFDNIEGVDVIIPDITICRQVLKEIIYGK